jgi:zinc protease
MNSGFQEFFLKRYLLILLLLASFFAPAVPLAGAPHATWQRPRGAQAPSVTQKVATPPTPLATDVKLANKVLPNGLEIIVLEDHSVPLVTVELAVRNGSYTEPPELNGLSHLYEHMFFKANRAVVNGEEYIKSIDKLGIVNNGETKEELVNYYFTTTTPNFPIAMRFMRDSTLYPGFDGRWFEQYRQTEPALYQRIKGLVEQQFESEREAVIGELDRQESNPFSSLGTEMTNRLFYKYPTRKSPGGTKATVRTATTDMMRLIQSRYYVPNNSAIVVTGDVTPAEAFQSVEELFGAWERRAKDPFVEFPLVEHPALPRSEAAIIKQPVQNVVINIGWHGPSIGKDDAATYAADVFSFILRQPNSRFQRALVDSGLVTGVGFNYYTQRNVGPIGLIAQTTPDKARAAVRAIYEELAHFDDPDYFTDEELESAKALLEAEDLYSREKLSDYAHTLSFWWASTGLEYFRGYLGRLRATSRTDISRYIKTYIQNKPHVGLALMSEESLTQSGLTTDDLLGTAKQKASAASAANSLSRMKGGKF